MVVVEAAHIFAPVKQVEGRKDVGARRADRAGDRRRADAGDGAERARRRIEEIEPAARDDAAACETAIIIAKAQIVANGQPFVGIESADQPVELAVERFALKAQFLGEGVELAIGVVIVGALERSEEPTPELPSLMRT